MSPKWLIAAIAIIVAIVAVSLGAYLLFPGAIRMQPMGGPVAIVQGGGDVPKHGFAGFGFDLHPEGRGILVGSVLPGSAAATSGLRVGDVLTAADGLRLSSKEDLQRILSAKKPSEVVRFDIDRDGKTTSVEVTLMSFAEMWRLQEANKAPPGPR